jgi:hypothetical protein
MNKSRSIIATWNLKGHILNSRKLTITMIYQIVGSQCDTHEIQEPNTHLKTWYTFEISIMVPNNRK